MKAKKSKAMKAVSITLQVDLLDRINARTAQTDQTRSQYFRRLVKQDLNGSEEPAKQAA